jgi:hypothetical protein
VQAVRTRRRWFKGFLNPYASLAPSFARRFMLSLVAFVIPVMTAAVISFSHRDTVPARVTSSGMSSCWAHQS